MRIDPGIRVRGPMTVTIGVIALSATLGVVTALLGIGFPGLLVTAGLALWVLPTRLGVPARSVLAAGAVGSAIILIGSVAAVVHTEVRPAALVIILVLAATALALAHPRSRTPHRSDPLLRRGDVAILLTCGALTLAVLAWGLGRSPADLVFQLSQGGDNSNHLNLIRSIQLGGGFQYAAPVPGLRNGMDFYPQGFAFLVAYLGWSVTGFDAVPTVAETVQTSWAVFVLQPVLAVTLLLLIVRAAARTDRRRRGRSVVAAVVVTTVTLLGLYGNLLTFGFQTQMFAINAVLAGVWWCTEPRLGLTGNRGRAVMILGLGLALVAVGNSWFLMAPPLVVLALLLVLPLLRGGAPWWFWPALALLAAATVQPILNGNPQAGGALLLVGGVRAFAPAMIPALVLVLVLVHRQDRGGGLLRPGWWRGQIGDRGTLGPTYWAVAAATALTVGVAAVQLAAAGTLSYYFFKVAYLPAVLAVAVLGVGAVRWYDRPDRLGTLRRQPVVTALSVVAGLALAVSCIRELPAFLDIPNHGSVDQDLVAGLLQEYPHGMPAGTDVLLAATCDARTTSQTTSWIGGLFNTWTDERDVYYLAIDGRPAEDDEDLLTYLRAARAADADIDITVHLGSECDRAPVLADRLPDWVTVVGS